MKSAGPGEISLYVSMLTYSPHETVTHACELENCWSSYAPTGRPTVTTSALQGASFLMEDDTDCREIQLEIGPS